MTTRATRSDAQRNRTLILDAAARLFGRTESVSIADVAEEAGLTRTTVYRHFADRDDMVDALLIHVAASAVPALIAEIEAAPLPEALDLLARAVVTLTHEHRFLIAATAHRFDQAARTAVADEPVALLLRRHERHLAPGVDVEWLSRCVRALCLTAVADDRPPAQVTADLATTLRRVVLA